jgi:hypothetical protein
MIRTLGRLLAKLTVALTAAIFLSITCISYSVQASGYQSNYEKIPAVNKMPPRVGTWAYTPTIIICEYAPISEVQIRSAVVFWKRLGHRFFDSQYKHDPLNKCNETNPAGYIVIHLVTIGVGLGETSLAETHFFVNSNTNKIEWAKIYLRKNVRETVLEHELGHALGYLHYDKPKHLMNSKWIEGGWEADGLKNN